MARETRDEIQSGEGQLAVPKVQEIAGKCRHECERAINMNHRKCLPSQ